MSTPQPVHAKICTRCGRDCAGRPRQKDRRGRYVCGECAAAASAAARAPAGEGAIPLADEPPRSTDGFAPFGPSPIPGPPSPAVVGPVGAVQCPQCRYDIRGLKEARCPECGMVLTSGAIRRMHEKNESRGIVRGAYLKPAIIGAVLTVILAPVLYWQVGPGWLVLLAGVLVGGTLAVGVVYLGCGLLFLGFDPPPTLVATQLLPVVAGTSLALAVFGSIGGILLALGIPIFVCIWLMHSMLDLDLQDAALTAIPSALSIYGVWVFVANTFL